MAALQFGWTVEFVRGPKTQAQNSQAAGIDGKGHQCGAAHAGRHYQGEGTDHEIKGWRGRTALLSACPVVHHRPGTQQLVVALPECQPKCLDLQQQQCFLGRNRRHAPCLPRHAPRLRRACAALKRPASPEALSPRPWSHNSLFRPGHRDAVGRPASHTALSCLSYRRQHHQRGSLFGLDGVVCRGALPEPSAARHSRIDGLFLSALAHHNKPARLGHARDVRCHAHRVSWLFLRAALVFR